MVELQAVQQGVAASDGIRVDLPWVIAAVTTVISSLAAALGVTYRGQIKALESENKRKDDLIDRLIRQIGRAADVQDRTVSLVEQRERTGRR